MECQIFGRSFDRLSTKYTFEEIFDNNLQSQYGEYVSLFWDKYGNDRCSLGNTIYDDEEYSGLVEKYCSGRRQSFQANLYNCVESIKTEGVKATKKSLGSSFYRYTKFIRDKEICVIPMSKEVIKDLCNTNTDYVLKTLQIDVM